MSARGPASKLLLIRCDASVAMGTGHVMRCTALAQAWQDAGGRVAFAMAEATATVERRLRTEGAELIRIPAQPGSDAKHLCLSRADGGPDSAFSLEPREFKAMVETVRETEKALGFAQMGPSPSEVNSRRFRRSLFVVEDVKQGELFTERNVRSIRPSDGLHPRHFLEVLGKRAASDVERGTPLSWALISR